jgi:hypothetical protein
LKFQISDEIPDLKVAIAFELEIQDKVARKNIRNHESPAGKHLTPATGSPDTAYQFRFINHISLFMNSASRGEKAPGSSGGCKPGAGG